MAAKARPVIDRVLEKTVIDGSGCWYYMGFTDAVGYGRVWNHGARWSKGARRELTHRVVYEHFVGPIPDGFHLDHTCHSSDWSCPGGKGCRHTRCCNPDHLDPVSPGEHLRRAHGLHDWRK